MKSEDYKAVLEDAKTTNILEYFENSGYTIQKCKDNYYVKEIPGLCIKPEKNQWYTHYENVGRTNNSIDCLLHYFDMTFNQAVYELTGVDIARDRSSDYTPTRPSYSPPKIINRVVQNKELKIPEQADNMRMMFAYFCKTRKIPAKIVEELVHAQLLYQSQSDVIVEVNGVTQKQKKQNAVFLHKDTNGEIIGGEIQGISSYKRFKGIIQGTGESVFKFTPIPDKKITKAFLFESAIDLMSFYTLCFSGDRKKLEGTTLISMAGLKPTIPKQLEREGIKIISCVDNDDAGRKFEQENNFQRSESVKRHLDYNGFKDWNELLIYRTINHIPHEIPHETKTEEKIQENNINATYIMRR